jgi:hypothetical protein
MLRVALRVQLDKGQYHPRQRMDPATYPAVRVDFGWHKTIHETTQIASTKPTIGTQVDNLRYRVLRYRVLRYRVLARLRQM